MQANDTSDKSGLELARAALATATVAARRAADLIKKAAPDSGALEWFEKGIADFVTEVDRAAEAAIVQVVARDFPDAVIVGEELTPDDAVSEGGLTFIADPLDGTTNFLHGYPQYAVSIGVLSGSEIIAAVVMNVPRGDLFTASKGGGTRLNGNPVQVSTTSSPRRALLGTGFPFRSPELLEHYARQFVAVSRQVSGIRRAGSAALDLADVACGRFDGFWELTLAPWDIAAGLLLVREAGGIVTDIAGAACQPSHGPVVAGNPDIHPWLLDAVQKASST